MSSRGFLLRTLEDDSFDQPELRPLSPNIVVSRSDFFNSHYGKIPTAIAGNALLTSCNRFGVFVQAFHSLLSDLFLLKSKNNRNKIENSSPR